MNSATQFQQLKLLENSELITLFNEFDAYYDPYFVLIKSPLVRTGEFVQLCRDWIPSHEDDLSGVDFNQLSDELLFFCISCDREVMDSFISLIMDSVDTPVYLAIFRHNCLGDPMETLKWCSQLLEEAEANSIGESALGLNDFTDRENWPGIDKYKHI